MAGHETHSSAGDVSLRDVREDDLPSFFEHQLSPDANRMAAFTVRDPADQDAFTARWARIVDDETITKKTVLFEGHVAGNVVSFERSGRTEVGYWIGEEYWGKGIATRALSMFLDHVGARPLYASVAKDNASSIRVLEKCGFTIVGEDKEFSSARGEEVEEFIFRLGADGRHGTQLSRCPSGRVP